MEDYIKAVCRCLPPLWATAVASLPSSVLSQVREIRLRAGCPLTLSLASENVTLPFFVSKAEIEECFLRFCGHAVHTHQDELAQGFVTTEDGVRVGVAGRAVCKNGDVVSCRDITSLCVRVTRPHIACASPLLPFVCQDGDVRGLLLCGAPSCGKTTVLRDVARLLSVRHSVAVVDERRELAAGELDACDVLSGYPKARGILQAVRTLSPEAVVVDELGDDAEWEAVMASCFLGVPIIASVHAAAVADITARAPVVRLLQNGGFASVAMMPPRRRRETVTRIWKARDFLEDRWDRADRVHLHGAGGHSGVAYEGQRGIMESMGETASSVV